MASSSAGVIVTNNKTDGAVFLCDESLMTIEGEIQMLVSNKKNIIEIVVYIDPISDHDIAAVTLKHPSSKKKLTDEELQIYEDFVASMISPIYGHHFKVVKEYQSKRSYAYYIDFYPVTVDGEILDVVHVVFRMADHKMNHGHEGFNPRQFIKSFTINNLDYTRMVPLIQRVDYLCDELQKGNYEELLTSTTEFEN